MSPSRRDFLKYSAGSALVLASSDLVGELLAQSPKGRVLESKFKGLADLALTDAKAAGCSYADIRFTRTFRLRQMRIQPEIDAYNLFNRSPVLTMNTRYGQQWQYAQATLGPRLVKFGLQVYF